MWMLIHLNCFCFAQKLCSQNFIRSPKFNLQRVSGRNRDRETGDRDRQTGDREKEKVNYGWDNTAIATVFAYLLLRLFGRFTYPYSYLTFLNCSTYIKYLKLISYMPHRAVSLLLNNFKKPLIKRLEKLTKYHEFCVILLFPFLQFKIWPSCRV